MATTGLRWVSGRVLSPLVEAYRTVRCPRCKQQRVVGIILQKIYDGILYWFCQECHLRWHAYSREANAYVHRMAEVMIERDE